jgi:excisionase family DNA binding protein
MADTVLIPLPGIGTLELPRSVYEAALKPFGATPAPTQPEPLLDAGELAQALNLPKSCVYERARRGDFPSVRVGKHLRFRRSEVLEALGTPAKGAVGRV